MMTFGELVSALDHGVRKLPKAEISGQLVQLLEPFESFCDSDGREATLRRLTDLKNSLLYNSVGDIKSSFLDFRQQIFDEGIENLEPTFKDHEFWMYMSQDRAKRIGLLFSSENHAVRLALNAVLKHIFGFLRPARRFLVKDLTKDMTIICDSRNWSFLKASGVQFKECLVIDSQDPEENSMLHFVKLPICRDGFELLCKNIHKN